MLRLLLERDDLARSIELGDPEPLWVGDVVEQGARAKVAGFELASDIDERLAAKDVVAEHDAERLMAHEVAGQADGMGDPERAALVAIGQVETEIEAIGQELDDVADDRPPRMTIAWVMPMPASVCNGK